MGAPCGSTATEKGERVGRLGKEMLTGGPGLSAGEREGEGGEAGWAWPKKKQGVRVGVSRPKAEREGGIPTSIYFFMPNFPNEILSRKKKINKTFCFPTNHHKRNAPA